VPGALVKFWSVGFNMVVAGVPPVKTLTLPIRFLAGPIIIALATPPGMQPVLSPMLMGIVVTMLCAGIIEIKCLRLQVGGRAIGRTVVFG